MGQRMVVGPQGRKWRLRRKWVHRRLTWRGRKGERSLDVLDGADLVLLGEDLPVVGVVVAVVGLLLVGIAAVLFVVPALIFVLELLLILALVGLGLVGRLLFRRPWTIEAIEVGSDHAFEWKVTGWRASGELLQSVGDQLQATGLPTGGTKVPA